MPELQGECAGCHRGVPYGYLPVVTAWDTVDWGKGLKIMKPKVLYCRPCGSNAGGLPQYAKRKSNLPKLPPTRLKGTSEVPDEVPEIPLKEIAVRVFSKLNKTEGKTSVQLAKEANLPETEVPRIKSVMKKLRDAGKVQLVEGRWVKV